MPWHISRSNPMKVYDERHIEICVCITVEAAALIVRAVNALPYEARDTFVRLRETEPPRDQITHSTMQADGCCARPIGKASLSGTLDQMKPWECPKCGTTYWPRQVGPIVNWEARAAVMVFKP